MTGGLKHAVFAAGCFWGVEHTVKKLPGVVDTEVGYTGGSLEHPTYEAVCRGDTGHVEAVRVAYDPTKTSYEALADAFFVLHDPTQQGGQGLDIGPQYASVLFFGDPNEREAALGARERAQAAHPEATITTEVRPLGTFWRAEEYHQGYIEKQETVG